MLKHWKLNHFIHTRALKLNSCSRILKEKPTATSPWAATQTVACLSFSHSTLSRSTYSAISTLAYAWKKQSILLFPEGNNTQLEARQPILTDFPGILVSEDDTKWRLCRSLLRFAGLAIHCTHFYQTILVYIIIRLMY